MGDHEHAGRTTKTYATPDVVVPQRKPLPKGSVGSKPRAREPGEKPRPKKIGMMFDAHSFQHLAPNPAFARAALRKAVEVAESQVAVMGSKLDRALAPDAMIAEPCAHLALAIETATSALEHNPPEPGEIDAQLQHLDTAVGKLYVLARKHQIPMRETHLEEIFDREDQLRKLYTSLGPTNRADNYYDGQLEPVAVTHESAPKAGAIARELEEGSEASTPRDRDELVAHILGFSGELGRALDVGYDHAVAVIQEPSLPKRPDIVEALVEVAMSVLAAQASAGIGVLLGSALKHASSAIGAAEHLGDRLTESLIDGFKDAGKENAKVGMLALGGLDTKPPSAVDSKLSPKTLYVMAAKQRTADAMDASSRSFVNRAPLLKRVPIDTLLAIRSALGPSLKKTLRETYSDLIVNEWINFGKAAADAGEEMREPNPHPISNPYSKLDQVSDPWGVLRVSVDVDADGNPRFLGAALPGVGDAVVAHLRGETRDLCTLPIHRLVEIAPHDSMSLPGGEFNLDPKGKISARPEMLSAAARLKWARIAKSPVGDTVSDDDVYRGMHALVRWLGSIHCSQMHGGEE